MARLYIIKDLIRKNGYTIKSFAEEINMSEQGLQKLIRENSTKVDTLERIANKLKVSVSVFFEKEIEEAVVGKVGEPDADYGTNDLIGDNIIYAVNKLALSIEKNADANILNAEANNRHSKNMEELIKILKNSKK